eukprot:26948_1
MSDNEESEEQNLLRQQQHVPQQEQVHSFARPVTFVLIIIVICIICLITLFIVNLYQFQSYDTTVSPTTEPTTSIYDKYDEALPEPGQIYYINNISNESITLNDTVSVIFNSDIINKCAMDIDNEKNELLNSSYVLINSQYIHLLNNSNFLISTSKIYDELPANCTIFPALKILSKLNITINDKPYLKLFVIQAKFTEYFSEINVNLTNITVHQIQSPHTLLSNQSNNLYELVQKYNLKNITSNITNDCKCNDSSQCIDIFGGIYKNSFNQFNNSHVINNNDCLHQANESKTRRSLMHKKFKMGLSIDADTKTTIKGETYINETTTLSTEFSLESGFDFFAGLFAEFQCSFGFFKLNSFKLIFGVETYFNAYINFMADGELNFQSNIVTKSVKFRFEIAFIPIIITLYAEIDVGLQLVLFKQELSAQAGYERIYHEYGIQYRNGHGWETINNAQDKLIWTHKFGGNFIEEDKDAKNVQHLNKNDCIELTVVPWIQLKVGIQFYDTIDIYVINKVPFHTDLQWPGLCADKVENVIDAYIQPQLKLTVSIYYELYLRISIDIFGQKWHPSNVALLAKPIMIIPEFDICIKFDIPYLDRQCSTYQQITIPPIKAECKWFGDGPMCRAHNCKEFGYDGTIERTSHCGDGWGCTIGDGHKICCCKSGTKTQRSDWCQTTDAEVQSPCLGDWCCDP